MIAFYENNLLYLKRTYAPNRIDNFNIFMDKIMFNDRPSTDEDIFFFDMISKKVSDNSYEGHRANIYEYVKKHHGIELVQNDYDPCKLKKFTIRTNYYHEQGLENNSYVLSTFLNSTLLPFTLDENISFIEAIYAKGEKYGKEYTAKYFPNFFLLCHEYLNNINFETVTMDTIKDQDAPILLKYADDNIKKNYKKNLEIGKENIKVLNLIKKINPEGSKKLSY